MARTRDVAERPVADADLMETARERFRFVADAEAKPRANQLADKLFAAGHHWPDKIKRQREADGQPCLEIDRLTPQIKQVTNQLRQNRPSVTITPVDSGADVETAEVFQGIIRHIEQVSDADVAYDTAGESAATIGIGYFRCLTRLIDATSKQQELYIERVRNRFCIYMDPTCQKIDFSDARYAFVVEDLPRKEYERLYPNSQAASLTEFSSIGNDVDHWFWEDTVRIAEYWYLEGGENGDRAKVFCRKINGIEVLERYEWAGQRIPIYPVIGEEVDIQGKVDYRGITRRAKDPQRMANYWKSAATESVALAPRAPFLVEVGQIEGLESFWNEANVRNWAYLPYKAKNISGTLAPPPARNVAEAPIQAIMATIQAAENDLRAVTGFYDVHENETREQSGRAIMARQRQGELGNSDYADGLRRAIRALGKDLVDLIPRYYDVPRVMRILGTDGQPRTVVVHAGNAEAAQQYEGMEGIQGIYDLSAGTYDVVVSAGQNFQTARQEFVELMSGIYQTRPELFQLTGDIFFENMDVPFAKQMAERMKKLLPPELQEQQDPTAIPPQVQAQMQQMDQALQQMQAENQQLKSGVAAKQIEAESKERIALAELATRERIAGMEFEVQRMKAGLEAQQAQQRTVTEAATKVQAEQAETARTVLKMDHEQRQQDVALAAQAEQADTAHVQTMEAESLKGEMAMARMAPKKGRTP